MKFPKIPAFLLLSAVTLMTVVCQASNFKAPQENEQDELISKAVSLSEELVNKLGAKQFFEQTLRVNITKAEFDQDHQSMLSLHATLNYDQMALNLAKCYARSFSEQDLMQMASIAQKNMQIDRLNPIHQKILFFWEQFIIQLQEPGPNHWSNYVVVPNLPEGIYLGPTDYKKTDS